jgi:hypothetical protein
MSVTFTQRQGDGNDGNRNEACELASVVKCYERLIKLLLLMTLRVGIFPFFSICRCFDSSAALKCR